MACRFIVYIDESGDEGFTFRPFPDAGSSDWFVLSAVIVPLYLDHTIRATAAVIRTALNLSPKRTIHFADLTHEKRVRAIEEIRQVPATFATVVINKHRIEQPDIFKSRFRLYFYTARLLLERISWFCRDFAKAEGWEDCEAKVIFEHRRRLSYDDFRDYLRTLRVATADPDDFLRLLTADVRIHWASINIDTIEAAQKHDYAGLQIADCVAGGIRHALEVNQWGNTEHRHVKNLKAQTYGRNGNFGSYGMKFFPEEPQECYWLTKHYK